jgi:hypothetical protein
MHISTVRHHSTHGKGNNAGRNTILLSGFPFTKCLKKTVEYFIYELYAYTYRQNRILFRRSKYYKARHFVTLFLTRTEQEAAWVPE